LTLTAESANVFDQAADRRAAAPLPPIAIAVRLGDLLAIG